MKNLLHVTYQTIFWVCNLTFLLVVCFGILSEIGSQILTGESISQNNREFLITLAVLIVISIICTVSGLWRFRKPPLQMISLFYGVEVPLFFLGILFFFLRQVLRIRLPELTPASALILGTVVVCMVSFYLEVLYGYAKRHQAIAWLQMSAHSLMPGVGVYVGLLLLFYAAPAAVILLFQFFQFQWVREFSYIWTSGKWWIARLLYALLRERCPIPVHALDIGKLLHSIWAPNLTRFCGSVWAKPHCYWFGGSGDCLDDSVPLIQCPAPDPGI